MKLFDKISLFVAGLATLTAAHPALVSLTRRGSSPSMTRPLPLISISETRSASILPISTERSTLIVTGSTECSDSALPIFTCSPDDSSDITGRDDGPTRSPSFSPHPIASSGNATNHYPWIIPTDSPEYNGSVYKQHFRAIRNSKDVQTFGEFLSVPHIVERNITGEPGACQEGAVPQRADFITLFYGFYCEFYYVSCSSGVKGGERFNGPITNIDISEFHGKDFKCGNIKEE